MVGVLYDFLTNQQTLCFFAKKQLPFLRILSQAAEDAGFPAGHRVALINTNSNANRTTGK